MLRLLTNIYDREIADDINLEILMRREGNKAGEGRKKVKIRVFWISKRFSDVLHFTVHVKQVRMYCVRTLPSNNILTSQGTTFCKTSECN